MVPGILEYCAPVAAVVITALGLLWCDGRRKSSQLVAEQSKSKVLADRVDTYQKERGTWTTDRAVAQTERVAMSLRLASVEKERDEAREEVKRERKAHRCTEDDRKARLLDAATWKGETGYYLDVYPVVYEEYLNVKSLAYALTSELNAKRDKERKENATRVLAESEHVVNAAIDWTRKPPNLMADAGL